MKPDNTIRKNRKIDQNKIIGNTIYSIVLGFVIYSVFIDHRHIEYFDGLCTELYKNGLLNFICNHKATIYHIIVTMLLMIYFVIDWFSFNVLVEIGKRESFGRMFLSICFLVFLGYIIVLTKTQLYNNTHIFLCLLLLYFSGTTISNVIGACKTGLGVVKNERIWVKWDFIVKLVLCPAGWVYLLFFKVDIDVIVTIWCLVVILAILLGIKCVRLTHLAKDIKDIQTDE
jgi:hypothetical protein